MNLERPIEKAEEGIDKLKGGTHRLDLYINGWLHGFECKNCGSECSAETEFVYQEAMPTKIWKCPDCNSRFYRD